MAFVQIIEFRTSDIEGARQIDEEWRRDRRQAHRAPSTASA